jgi:hypothetical protein
MLYPIIFAHCHRLSHITAAILLVSCYRAHHTLMVYTQAAASTSFQALLSRRHLQLEIILVVREKQL